MKQIENATMAEEIKSMLENNNSLSYISNNVEDTKYIAYTLAEYIKECEIIVLNGELGAGKTAFMIGFAEFFGIENQISSPTFTIVNEYETKDFKKIFHFDVYRLKDGLEFENSIGTDYFFEGICIIEWGEIIKNILPDNTIYIDILKDDTSLDTRIINIRRG